MKDSADRAILALALGALGIAFAAILAKLAVNVDGDAGRGVILSPVAVAFWRMLLAAPVFAGASLRGASPAQLWSGLRPHWKSVVLPGFFFAADLGVWHWSFEYTSVANSTLEANFAVVLVSLCGWLFLGERFGAAFFAGAALALAGMVVLVGASFSHEGVAWIGDLMGLGVAVCYTGYQLSTKVLLGRVPLNALMTVTSLVASVFLAVGAALSPGRFFPVTAGGWASVVALALVSQVFGQGLIAYGMKRLPASFSSVVLILQPVGTALLGWLILGQSLTSVQAAGGGLVVVGIYLAKRGSLTGSAAPRTRA